MRALFLGHFAAGVAPRILAKVKTPLETSILDDEGDAAHLAPLLSQAEIVVGHIWRPSFPPAPRPRMTPIAIARIYHEVGARADSTSKPRRLRFARYSLPPTFTAKGSNSS